MKTEPARSWRILEASAAVLLWLQGTRVLLALLFGVVYDAVFDAELPAGQLALVSGLLVLSLLAPLLVSQLFPDKKQPKGDQDFILFAAILVSAVARIPAGSGSPPLRLMSSIVVMGASSVYLARLAAKYGALFAPAVAYGLVLDQLFRIAGNTWDISLQPGFTPAQVLVSLAIIAIAWTEVSRAAKQTEPLSPGRLGFSGALGLGGFLFLQSAVASQPNVLARWTGVPYSIAAPTLLLVTLVPLLPISEQAFSRYGGWPLQLIGRSGVLVRTVILLVPVLGGLVVGRRGSGFVALLALLLTQLVLMGALGQFVRPQATDAHKNGRRQGLYMTIALLVFLLLHISYAFAFTYPYTIAAFRNAGLTIILIGAILSLLTGWFRPPDLEPQPSTPINSHMVLLAMLVLLGAVLRTRSAPIVSQLAKQSIRVASYNMHYGFDTDWNSTLQEQARVIRASGADVVLLQEVDAGRATSYGVDHALWLGRRLGMQAVFAPALEGLSGVALLTRLPINSSDWALLPSQLEQTALVHSQLAWDHSGLDVYGVWLGLEESERNRQIDSALSIIGDTQDAVLAGDMNCTPDSGVYQTLEAAGFADPFVVTGELPAYTDPAVSPSKRIDYVWVRGAEPTAAQVLPSLASDHRLIVVEIRKP